LFHKGCSRFLPLSVINSRLEKTTTIVKALGANIKTLIIDRGFYSASNIEMLCESNLKFIIPLPSNLKLTEKMLSSSGEKLEQIHNHLVFQKEVIFYDQTECQIGNNTFTAFVFMDDKRRSYETQILLLKLHEVEDLFKRKKFYDVDSAKEFIDSCFKGCSKLFEISKNTQGNIIIKRDTKALTSKQSKLGKFILITNKEDIDARLIIAMYRQRDSVEKIFDSVKNELKIDRLRIHSRDALEGRLFIAFIAVILYMAILQELKNTDLIKKYSIAKIMMELRKIRVIEFSDAENMLSETTKTQREILSALNIELPNKPRY
jgi:transposase